jgi:type 1 glutamine amidotransferase
VARFEELIMRTKRALFASLLTTLCSCSQQQAETTTGGGSHGKPAKPKKLLYWTYSAGFKHGSLGLSEKIVTQIGSDSGVFEATTNRGYLKSKDQIDLSYVTPEYLAQFDAMMFYTTGELPLNDAQKQAMLDFIKNGKAFIGIHSATDTFYKWPAYGEMIGAYFAGHPWGAGDPAETFKIEDAKHPATRMLPPEWTIQDEIYQAGPPYSRKVLHVLISMDTAKTNMNKKGLLYGKDGDYALVWCRNYGKGRVFYTGLGHRDDVWNNPLFQQHLLGGIKWAMGLEPGDATPNPK